MAEKPRKGFTIMNKCIWLLTFGLILVFTGCKKKDTQNQQNTDFFPPVYVDFTVNLALPNYSSLIFPNGYAYENNYGYKGVVIYNTGFGGSNQYVAFDRTCPYKPDSACSRVIVDGTNVYLKCGSMVSGSFVPCCNSKFVAQNGGWVDGPAGRGLRQYFVFENGSGFLRITSMPQ